MQTDETKLNEDFEKRSTNLSASARAATYVAVVAGRYNPKKGKPGWAEQQRKRGLWTDVRLLDADNLAAWLEQSPVTALWMAHELGRPAAALTLPEEALRVWSSATEPPLPADVLLLGSSRMTHADTVRDWLVNPKGVGWLGVRGVPDEEARAFALASIVLDRDESRRERTLARTIVVESEEAWRWLVRTSTPQNPFVLVPDFPGADVKAARTRALVVSPAAAGEHPDMLIDVDDYVAFDALQGRLVELGMREEDARQLVSRASGRIFDLRRLLGDVTLPAWAREYPVRQWLPLLMLERWRPGYPADGRVIERLGASAGEVERLCEELSSLADRPVRRAEEWDTGVTWEWCAADTVWMQLAGRVPSVDLDRFRSVALEVLETQDPKYDAPARERFVAGVTDRRERPSGALREGVGRTLARLGNRTGAEREHSVSRRGPSVASFVVRAVLTPSWKRWASLSAELPWLAEAAPEEFVAALSVSLADSSGCARLLAEEDSWSSPHTGLLWALERLAWHPRWMPRCADTLAELAARDPGGRASNRPHASLHNILRAVAPQTTASMEDRLAALDRALARHSETGWKLLRDLLSDARGGVIWESSRPEYLVVEDMPDRPGSTLREPARRFLHAVLARAIQAAGSNAKRWHALLAPNGRWQQDIEAALLEAFERAEPEITEGRDELWHALRKPVAWARLRDDEALLARLQSVQARLAPPRAAERLAWLFGGVTFDTFAKDWRENEAIAAQERDAALLAIVSEEDPWTELARLAKETDHPALLGHHLATSPFAEAFLERVRSGTLDDALRGAQPMFLVRLIEQRGDEWAVETLRALVACGRTQEAVDAVAWLGVIPLWWRLAERVGGDVASGYWKQARVWNFRDLVDPERAEAADKLLCHGREASLIYALGPATDPLITSSQIIAALEGIASRPGAPETAAHLQSDHFAWSIEQAFLALDRAGDVDDSRLAALELQLLRLVLGTTRSARALYRVLGDQPKEFVSLLVMIYPEEGASRDAPVDDALRRAEEAAWRVLHEWRGFPGDSLPLGDERERHLESWSASVLRLSAEVNRGRVARGELATVLARVPAAEDGVWPCVAVRRMLEREMGDELARAISFGKWNLRGMHARSVGEGGEQERRLAAGYREGAQKLRREWPRASAMLDTLADGYNREAEHHDDHARTERQRAGIDLERVTGTTMSQPAPETAPPPYVEQLFLDGMTFVSGARPTLGVRLSLLTGDNSTGKSVVLEALWWALTASWTNDGRPVLPDRAVNGKARIGLRFSDGAEHHARFDLKREVWERPEAWARANALAVHARIDGGFSVFDPIRGTTLRMNRDEVFDGQRIDGAQSCNGLIDDLTQWKARQRRLHDRMNDILTRLSPGEEPLKLGEPTRVSIHDTRDFPTVVLPYGAIPVSQVSASVQRILGLAYVIVWAWHEHQQAARLAQEPTARSVVLLIDEVEAHLHPEWQRRILRGLLEAVDLVGEDVGVQAVVVTHSPLVVASAEAVFDPARDKLLHLALRDGRVVFEDLPFVKEGDVSNWLTSPVFGLRTSRSVEAERTLRRATELLTSSETTPDALRTLDAELRGALSPTDPFFVRWVHHLRRQGVEP